MGVCEQPSLSRALADGGDAAVHHVAGGDDVCAGLGLADGGAGQEFEGGVVVDFEAVAAFNDDAAVAVAGVLAETDVGDEDQLPGGVGAAQGAQGLLNDAAFFPCAGAVLVLGFGQAEEQEAAEAEAGGFFGFEDGFVDGEVEDAGHGADFFAYAFAGADEQGVDQVAGLKDRFAHQGAHGGAAAEAAHTHLRESHGSILVDVWWERAAKEAVGCWLRAASFQLSALSFQPSAFS